MSVLNSAILTSVAHLSRIAVGFILLKIIAFYLGAEGMGALGHFMSASTMVYMIAGGGILNAVIKYSAEYSRQPKSLLRFISASATYSFGFCLLILCIGAACSKLIANMVFKDPGMYWVIIVLAIAQFLFAFVNLVVGVSNGLMQTSVYSRVQIFGSFFVLPIIWGLTSKLGITGAALSIVAMYSITFFPAFYYYYKSNFRGRIKVIKLKKIEIKRLSSYTLMLIASAITFPIVEIILRQTLISMSGYASAGIWQGAIKLSSAYLGFFTVFLAYYFMPIISRLDTKREIGIMTIKFSGLVMAVFCFGAGILYVGRDLFIPLILSASFSSLDDIIGYQLVGDFFRVLSYVIGFVAVAKAAAKIYIAAELIQNALFLICSTVMLKMYPDAKGVMVGYALSYSIYFVIALCAFVFYLKSNNVNGEINALCR